MKLRRQSQISTKYKLRQDTGHARVNQNPAMSVFMKFVMCACQSVCVVYTGFVLCVSYMFIQSTNLCLSFMSSRMYLCHNLFQIQIIHSEGKYLENSNKKHMYLIE